MPAAPSQVRKQRRADIVGQVRDDPRRRAGQERTRIEGERIGLDDLEPPRIARGDLAEGRQAARVALDRDDARGAGRKKRAGETAGTRPDLDDRDARRGSRRRGRCGSSG